MFLRKSQRALLDDETGRVAKREVGEDCNAQSNRSMYYCQLLNQLKSLNMRLPQEESSK